MKYVMKYQIGEYVNLRRMAEWHLATIVDFRNYQYKLSLPLEDGRCLTKYAYEDELFPERICTLLYT